MSHSLPSLSAQDALDDIDMELLQDAVQRDDLGQSVQNARRFQQEARKETLDAGAAKPDYRTLAARQFQINDMLLTLLQELATRQRSLELDLRVYAPRRVGAGAHAAGAAAAGSNSGTDGSAPDGSAPDDSALDDSALDDSALDDESDEERIPPLSEALVRRLDAIQAVMRDDALALQLEVTPNDTPVVGRLIGNLRAAVHSLVVFYGNQLAARQSEINRVFGGAIQQLMLQQARDGANLTAEVQALAAEVAALRAERTHAAGSTTAGAAGGQENEQP